MYNGPRFNTGRTVGALALVAAGLAGCSTGSASTDATPEHAADALVVEAPAVTTTVVDAADGEGDGGATTVTPTTAPPTTATPSTPDPVVDASTNDTDTSEPATPGAAGFRGVSLVDELVVVDAPDGTEVARLPEATAFGTPTVVRVLDRRPGWVEVLVPIRPNDLTGWVRDTDVRLEAVDAEIHIDLAARTLRLTENGETTGEWPVAIGRSDRPTPTGSFFITDKLATGDAGSVWGSHAFGVSAYSDVLDDFIGGIGQVGIHGTNDPSSIGNDVSSGCIRLPNEVIDDLITRLPLGTPVHIV